MKTLIIHGRPPEKAPLRSPREGRQECDLWGVTRSNAKFWGGRLLDWTGWCDVHPLVPFNGFDGIPARRPEGWRWMLAQDGTRPIWLFHPEDFPRDAVVNRAEALARFNAVPGATRFPIRELMDYFGGERFGFAAGEPCRWFVCQLGMMIAKAVFDGCYNRIILNGVGDIGTISHQHVHRDTLAWMFFARGAGIPVTVEGPSVYSNPRHVYSFGAFNFDDLAKGRAEERQPQTPQAWADKAEFDRARGRPVRRF